MTRQTTATLTRVVRHALHRRSLRDIAAHTGIGKNRLHALRSAPSDTRLHELIKLRQALLLDLRITLPD